MSKTPKKGRTNWRPMAPRITAGEWAKALCIAVAMGLVAAIAVFLLPAGLGDDRPLPVVIHRLMTANPAACYSVDGEYYDWIELMNISSAPVDLKGWKLTDGADLREAYVFKSHVLSPGESLRVYCADAPEGYAGDALFTGFGLSSDGEFLLLADPQQHISALDVPPLGRKDVFQRDPETGRYSGVPFYQALGMATEFADSLTPAYDPDGLTINELMAANRATLMDEDADFSDWLELYNGSGQPIDLAGWALSDDDVNQRKWVFPEVSIQPNEYLLVFASGKDRRRAGAQLHANFRLSSRGEAVRLYNPQGDAVSYVEYDAAVADQSISREADGSLTVLLDPSPGYPNTPEGARAFDAASDMLTNRRGLYINEIYAMGDGPDWVEIHNTSKEALDLSGMGLTDNPAKPRKWQFPEGATLRAGGYAVIALTGAVTEDVIWEGEQAKAPDFTADYTADFALSEGEMVCLSSPKGKLLDRVKLYDQHRGVSYGRAEGHDGYRFFADPTPGKANARKSYAGVTQAVAFSVPPGVVREQAVSLSLSSEPGAAIYYTTDGSEPSDQSTRYAGPIDLKGNAFIKVLAVAEDKVPAQVATVTYIFGPHTLRLVSVMGKTSQLNGEKGVLNTGTKAEIPVYTEIYEPDGTKLAGQNCVLELIGHHSRVNYAQKSFKLTAKRETGDTRFRAKLFTNRDYEEVKSIVLRAGGQDADQTKMRDSILTSLAADTSVMYQETELCVVYVNGQYWGLYNMREHIDTHSIAQFEGWTDPDGVVLGEGTGESTADYQKLLKWVNGHSLSRDENVEALREMMDIENYLDYVILEMYTDNQDMNNVRFYCSPREDPRFKWILFDLDLSFQLDRNNAGDWLKDTVGTITTQTTTPFKQLMSNDAVRDYFLTRMGVLLATTLSTENVVAKIDRRAELMQDEIKRNCKRWGWKKASWERYVNEMKSYARRRPGLLIKDLCKTFKLSDMEQQLYFGDAMAKIVQ